MLISISRWFMPTHMALPATLSALTDRLAVASTPTASIETSIMPPPVYSAIFESASSLPELIAKSAPSFSALASRLSLMSTTITRPGFCSFTICNMHSPIMPAPTISTSLPARSPALTTLP